MSIISLYKIEEEAKSQPRELNKILRRLLLPFGGGEFFFNSEEKPFFIVDLTLPAENEIGVNFDVRLAYAIIALVREHGVSEITLGAYVEDGFDFEQVLKNSSYAKLRELENVKIIDLRTTPVVRRATDTALVVDHANICQPAVNADLVISLAKFRCGEGKLFGSALNNVTHAACAEQEYPFEQQQRFLIDIYSVLSPDLTIVDGIIGDSGFQPQHGDFILAASDAVAADAVLAALAGLELNEVEYLQLAAQYGLGVGEPADIHLYGDDISDMMV